jgi:hypothetical protein
MFADRLVQAPRKLNISDPGSVKRFKRVIPRNFEIFLRFTHRYWFHEVADQAQAKALFGCPHSIWASTRSTPRSRNAFTT